MFRHFRRDVQAVLDRDPAARSMWEVMLAYPSFKAIRRHRRAHWCWNRGYKLVARMISNRNRRRTGIDIHPGAQIGEGLFIDHGMGVVIGETAQIGENVTLYQGVTLGGTGKDTGKRHPTIGNNVVIGAGAKVLGPFTVGENAKIGSGAIVLREVPAYATVVGNPGRVVRMHNERLLGLDQINLPDPVKQRIDQLTERLERLDRCFRRNMGNMNCEDCLDSSEDFCPKNNEEELIYEDL